MMKEPRKNGLCSRSEVTRNDERKNGSITPESISKLVGDLNVAEGSPTSDPNQVPAQHDGAEEQPITTPHKKKRTASDTGSETTTSSPSLPSLQLQLESPLEITIHNGDGVTEKETCSLDQRALFEIHGSKCAIRNRMGRLEEEAEKAKHDAIEAQKRHRDSGHDESTAAPMAVVHLRRYKSLRREFERCAAKLANLEATELALESAGSDGRVVETYGLVKEAFRDIRHANRGVSKEENVVAPMECAGHDDSGRTEWKRWHKHAFVGLALLVISLAAATTGLAVYVSMDKEDDEGDSLFCGISFKDASKSCSTPCPRGSLAECPVGQACFSGVACSLHRPESFVCGRTFEEADSACTDPCPSGDSSDCPPEMACFAHTSCARKLLSDAPSSAPSATRSLTYFADHLDWVQIGRDRSLEGDE